MKIPYVDLSLQWKKEKKDLGPIVNRVFEKVNSLEKNYLLN